jgi:hypothetical protein
MGVGWRGSPCACCARTRRRAAAADETSIDWVVLLFALVVCGVTASADRRLSAGARDAARALRRAARRRTRIDDGPRAIAVAQALVAVESRARRGARCRRRLMIRTVRNLLNVDPGFRSEAC